MAATTTAAAKSSTSAPKLKSFTPLLLLLILLFSIVSGGSSANRIRAGNKNNNQIPSCCDMLSEEQCSQNLKCRWCRSESLDDMCFTKSDALRLPPQVFTCKLIRFSQKF